MAKFLTLKDLWPWPWIGSYCIPSCITHWPLPTCQISLKSKKLSVDGQTSVRTFDTGSIKSTLTKNWPNNAKKPSVLLDRTGPIRSTVTIRYWIGRSNFIWTVRSLALLGRLWQRIERIMQKKPAASRHYEAVSSAWANILTTVKYTYDSLDHVDSVFAHLVGECKNVDDFLGVSLIKQAVESNERSSPTNTSTNTTCQSSDNVQH